MNIQVKTSSGITLVPLDAKLFEQRKIFIRGEINSAVADDFAAQALILCKEDSAAPIDVLIDSHGGEINAGLAVYDIMQTLPTPVRTFCIGTAYSMAAVLFAGGRERAMLLHSELMLHEPLLGNRVGGNASSIKFVSESLMATRKTINKLIAKHTGKSESEIEKETSFDHYFSAEESIVFGLADKIVGFDNILGV